MKSFIRLSLLTLLMTQTMFAASPARTVSFVVDARSGRLAKHGIEQLGAALRDAGWTTQIAGDADRITDVFMVLAGTAPANGPAARALRHASIALPTTPESFVVRKLTLRGKPAVVLCGADDRGLMNALLEVAAQVRANESPTGDPLAFIRDVSSA